MDLGFSICKAQLHLARGALSQKSYGLHPRWTARWDAMSVSMARKMTALWRLGTGRHEGHEGHEGLDSQVHVALASGSDRFSEICSLGQDGQVNAPQIPCLTMPTVLLLIFKKFSKTMQNDKAARSIFKPHALFSYARCISSPKVTKLHHLLLDPLLTDCSKRQSEEVLHGFSGC